MINKPDDNLFNRRLIAYAGLIFSVIWFIAILVIDVCLILSDKEFAVAKVTLYLGVPASITGLGFWKYLKACEEDDAKDKRNNNSLQRDKAGDGHRSGTD